MQQRVKLTMLGKDAAFLASLLDDLQAWSKVPPVVKVSNPHSDP